MQTFKSLSILAAIFVFSVPALASSPRGHSEQTDSNILLGDIDSGGYGAPVMRYSQVGGRDGLFAGARGGWIINHSFVLGGAAYGLASTYELPGDRLSFGYGGVMLEYIVSPDRLFHVSFDTVIGGGAVSPRGSHSPNGVFVVEPELDAIVNVTPSIRAGIGISYRFTRGTKIANLSDADLSGVGANLLVQFGSF